MKFDVTAIETHKTIRGGYPVTGTNTKKYEITSDQYPTFANLFANHEADVMEFSMVTGNRQLDIKVERRRIDIKI